jgi:hypothetical protein
MPEPLSRASDIDALYACFCDSLPEALRTPGRTLAFRLGLVPDPGIPWSATFKHDVTLQAPALIAEGLTGVTQTDVERAVLAHMLAVIEAFGTDRIMDGQTEDTPELRRLLERMRGARNQALLDFGGLASVELATVADRRTLESIASERNLFTLGHAVSLAAYEAVSAGKQAVGLPASVALARKASLTNEQLQLVERTLMGVWLGLQFQDDVIDWEDDARRGGAWAVLIARHRRRKPADAGSDYGMNEMVLGSGALADMLEVAVQRFQVAAQGAGALGAHALAEWAVGCEQEARASWEGERAHPGYLRRVTKLGPWALEVLG